MSSQTTHEPDNRPAAYEEDGKYIFRASALGTHEHALAALLCDYAPTGTPHFLEAAFAFGHEHEQAVVDKWLEDNPDWALVSQQEEIEYHVTDTIVVRGHTDGAVLNRKTGERRVLEVKTLGKDLHRAWVTGKLYDRMPTYGFQAAMYMEATGLAVQYVVMDKEAYKVNGEYVLSDKVVTEPPVDLAEVVEKLIRVVNAAKKGELISSLGCKGLCPVQYLHDEFEEVDDVVVGSDRLGELAARYREVKVEYDALDAELKVLRSELKDELGDVKKAKHGQYTVTLVEQTRDGWDKAKMEADGVADKYRKPFSYAYALVKEA